MARIIVTGVSSYTGACIAAALSGRGFGVVGLCRRGAAAYAGRTARRLALARSSGVELVFDVDASRFPEWMTQQHADVWVHHHHPMENFRSEQYDVRSAESAVLDSVPELVMALAGRGVGLVVYSSTYFEAGEGGQAPDARVTPYAALKARVHEALALATAHAGLELSRVVIPAPTGALENIDRLTPQLLLAGERRTPFVLRSPDSVMDLVPGEGLAASYVELIERGLAGEGGCTVRPSGLVTTAAEWAAQVDERLARRLGLRLDVEVPPPAERGPAVRFENPSAERRAFDWETFFARYAAEWSGD